MSESNRSQLRLNPPEFMMNLKEVIGWAVVKAAAGKVARIASHRWAEH